MAKVRQEGNSRGKEVRLTSFRDLSAAESLWSAGSDSCSAGDVSQDDASKGERRNTTEMTKEPLFPAELCKALRDQVEALTEENARLRKGMEEAEAGRGRWQDGLASPLQGVGRASDLAANKIVELSKRVRELSAELAASQTRARNAEFRLVTTPGVGNKPSIDGSGDSCSEIRELTEKLNASNTKLCEARTQVSQLKHEIKLAQKALSSELGDSTQMQSALSNTGWRGRAQQILTLQQKVQELTDKLNQNSNVTTEKANVSALLAQRAAEKERAAEQQKEVDALKSEVEELKKKVEASRARSRVVTSELNSVRGKLTSSQEKNSHNDQLIAALTGQLTAAAEKSRERETTVTKKFEEQVASLRQELAQTSLECMSEMLRERARASDLQNIIAERDMKIARMEEKLSNNQNVVRNEATGEHNRPFSRASSFDRSSNSSCQEVLSFACEAERMRLMELLTITNRRLEEERHTLDRVQEMLRVERHKCAKMETKLARLELDKAGCSRSAGYKRDKPKSHTPAEWESLKDKAELLEEKCLALETRLNCLRQEKDEDSRRYLNLIEETRHSFLDHLKKSSV